MIIDTLTLRERLQEKFPESRISWRVARETNAGDKVQVLAYIDNRDVMYRLDEVCGPENWKNEYREWRGGSLCGISIRVGDEWVTKWDGAGDTNVEATKGGLSDSMKRAAVQWGIGRYLYYLGPTYAVLKSSGDHYHYNKETKKSAYWDTPKLPKEFLPTTNE